MFNVYCQKKGKMNSKKNFSIFSSLIVIVILISACSSSKATPSGENASPVDQKPLVQETTPASPTSDSSYNTADACTLLPKDDVSKVLGLTIITAESSGLGGVCSYKTTNLGIDFTVSHSGGIKAMNTTMTNLGDLALIVPGLGDLAFYNTNSANALFVLKGDAEFLFGMSDLNYQLLDPAFVQAIEKALAEQLLSNLP